MDNRGWKTLLLLFISGSVLIQTVSSPSYEWGLKGNSALLQCNLPLGSWREMQWKFENKIIYSYADGIVDYPGRSNKYSVKVDGNDFPLTVNNLGYEDGGKFTCYSLDTSGNQHIIFLGVIGDINLKTDKFQPVEGEEVLFTCEASMGGLTNYPSHEIPTLKIRWSQDDIYVGAEVPENVGSNVLKVVFRTTAEAFMQGKNLVCEAITPHQTVLASDQLELEVLFLVRNITYKPERTIYEPGDTIICEASGHPKPAFVWREISGHGTTINGAVLHITEDMVSTTSWECTAANNVRGNSSQKTTRVDIKTGSQSAAWDSTGLIIGLCVLGGIILVIICFVCFKKRREAESRDIERVPMVEYSDESKEWVTTIKGFGGPADLDRKSADLTQMLDGVENGDERFNPEIFTAFVGKASCLIDSYNYFPNLEKMADFYGNVHQKPEEGPLRMLLHQLTDKYHRGILDRDQEKLERLIQIIVPADTVDKRSMFLPALLSRSKYVSESIFPFIWTWTFISTLRTLLENGACPAFKEKDMEIRERRKRETAQYYFFSSIPGILLFNHYLTEVIKDENGEKDEFGELIPKFLKDDKNERMYFRGTALHAIVDIDWNKLKKDINEVPPYFEQEYKDIIQRIMDLDTTLLDSRDWKNRTALDIFKEKEEISSFFIRNPRDFYQILSPDN